MASTKAWVDALNKILPVQYPDFKTTQVYSQIKKLGLTAVEWIELEIPISTEQHISIFLKETKNFLEANKPCLFIFDPKDSSVRKGFFVDVTDTSIIEQWLLENKQDLSKYYYLITSQIVNNGHAIIGSVFSDGKGKLFCETLHLPAGSSHRLLSQPKTDISKNLDHFTADNFELETAKAKFLSLGDIRQIINEYSDKKGYFEFVKGSHLGKTEIVTTGFEDSLLFVFPTAIHSNKARSRHQRAAAMRLRQNQ